MLIHFHMLSLYKSLIISKYAFSLATNLLNSNHMIQTYTPKDVFSLQISFTLIKVCYFTLSIQFIFMTDSVRGIPSFLSFGNVFTHLTILVSHHDGCRLMHPAMWDIEQFRFAFMTDVAWCIPPCWSFSISIQFKMSSIDQFVYNSINRSHAINCQTFQISHFQIHMHSHNIISKIYSFHIIISDLFGKLPKHFKSEYNYGEQRTNNT